MVQVGRGMTYKYLVVYMFDGGTGRAFYTTKVPIDTERGLLVLERTIEKDSERKNVGVLNIIKLKG